MTGYLLDTSVISDLVRNINGRSKQRLLQIRADSVCTSIIVASELRFGALRKGSERITRQVESFLRTIPVLPFETPDDLAYARIRVELERTGNLIGGNDLFIAAHAVSRGLTLVSDNEREFERVAGLKWENWQR